MNRKRLLGPPDLCIDTYIRHRQSGKLLKSQIRYSSIDYRIFQSIVVGCRVVELDQLSELNDLDMLVLHVRIIQIHVLLTELTMSTWIQGRPLFF
jgi:hypothetical protein